MERDTNLEAVRAAIRYLLLVLILLYLISGLGITQYPIIERLTLGLLTKSMAFKIHDFLLVPFVVVLLVHVLLGPTMRIYSHFKKRQRQKHQ
jgi:thiosulfate reductase cytochrome b subunit